MAFVVWVPKPVPNSVTNPPGEIGYPGGAKLADVTKITIYLCNPRDVPKARGILQTYFAGHPPGSTLCILRGLANPNFLLEIEAIAAM